MWAMSSRTSVKSLEHASVMYELLVATGDTEHSGTLNDIYATLIGSAGQSERQQLNNLGIDFMRGSIGVYHIKSNVDLGDILIVRLDKVAFLVDDTWFCRYVEIRALGGHVYWFPANQWLEHGSMELREGKGILPQQDTLPILKTLRIKKLTENQKIYRWLNWQPGLPLGIDAKSIHDLPLDARFDNEKTADFERALYHATRELSLAVLINSLQTSWSNIDDFRRIFVRSKSATAEYVSGHWDPDWFFGYQFLNGANPVLIKRCNKLPEKFPVTTDMVKDSLVRGLSLEEEIQNGKVYIMDYECLDGLLGNATKPEEPLYLAAPICLLYVNEEEQLLPIAIQLSQNQSSINPIFLPSDSVHDWLLSKMWVRAMDFQVHQIAMHFMGTHLLAELFCVATFRQLSTVHPVHMLLGQHLRFTLEINVRARDQLIGKGAFVDKATSIGGGSHMQLAIRAFNALSYRQLCIPNDIADRDVADLPGYFYRDDALNIWMAISKFVTEILRLYYKSDGDVVKDSETQNWIGDINHGLLHKKSSGFPVNFTSVKDLSEFVTMVVFLCSAQHSALNNSQFDFYSWVPNAPSAMRTPPPTTKGAVDMPYIMQTLPDVTRSCITMAITSLLSRTTVETFLGEFPENLFQTPEALKAIHEFQVTLKALTDSIAERNKSLPIKASYLSPDTIVNSITT